MSNKTIILFISLFLLLVVGMFTFTMLKKGEIKENEQPSVVTDNSASDAYNISRIEGKHFFIDGVHTIVGEINMPTLCDLLTTDATVGESNPERITFMFNVVNTTGDCEQNQNAQRFKVSATASKLASMTALFMGKEVPLNLIEAMPGETPEDYELYIKG